jgi:hypothetical protein
MSSADCIFAQNALAALCHTLRVLTFAERAMIASHAPPDELEWIRMPLMSTQKSLRDILDDFPELLAMQHTTLLQSGCLKLAQRLNDAPIGSVEFPDQTWREVLPYANPDDIALWAQKGLSIGGSYKSVFDSLDVVAKDQPDKAGLLAAAISKHIGAKVPGRFAGSAFWDVLDTLNIKSPFLAPYLRAQVANFPEQTRFAVAEAVRKNNLPALVRFYLAGVKPDWLTSDERKSEAVRSFLNMTQSNHGRLMIKSSIGELEDFLPDPVSRIAVFH